MIICCGNLPVVRTAALWHDAAMQFDKDASQARDYCAAKDATHRAARPDPSLRKVRLLRMTIQTAHYLARPALLNP